MARDNLILDDLTFVIASTQRYFINFTLYATARLKPVVKSVLLNSDSPKGFIRDGCPRDPWQIQLMI